LLEYELLELPYRVFILDDEYLLRHEAKVINFFPRLADS
jgi:hypothetical protein